MSSIVTVLDIFMWVCFAISLLFGFLRGMKKSIYHTVITVTLIILTTIFVTPIASLLTNIKIGGTGIEELIKSSITELSDAASETLSDYVKAFAVAILRLPIYYLLLFINLVILRPILKAIIKAIMKKIWPDPTDEDGKPLKPKMSSRGLGVAVTLVAFIFSFIALMSPVLGAVGLVEDVIDNKDLLMAEGSGEKVEEVVESDIFDTVSDGIDELNKKPFFAIVRIFSGKNYKSQVSVFSNLLKVKTKNGTFKIKKELDCVIPIAAVVIEAKDSEDVMGVIAEHRTAICTALESSDVINIFMPLVVEIGDSLVTEADFDFTVLKDIDWEKEKSNLIGIVDATICLLDETDFNLDDPIAVLNSEKLPGALKNFGKSLQESYLVKDVALVFGNKYLQDALKEAVPEELNVIVKIADLSRIDIEKDFETFGYVANDIYKMGLVTGGEFNAIESRNEIKDLILLVFNISSIVGNESDLVKQLLAYTNMDQQLDDMGVSINYSGVVWSNEKAILAQVVYNILELCAEEGITSFDDADVLELFKKNMSNPLVTNSLDLIVSSKLLSIDMTKLILNSFAGDAINTEFTIGDNTYDVADYIEELDLANRDWEAELDDVQDLINSFDTSDATTFKAQLQDVAKGDTISADIAKKIIEAMENNGD